MESLFREQKKQIELKNALVQSEIDKVLKTIYKRQEQSEELRDINYIEKVKEDNAQANDVLHQLERKKAIVNQKNLEHKVATNAERQKQEVLRAEKLRQLLRQNTPEIRELERQLLEARVSKERAVQQAHKLAIKEQNMEKEKLEAENLAKEIEKEKNELESKIQQEQLAKRRYHKALDDQVNKQLESSKESGQDATKERMIINKILEKLQEEDLTREQKRIEDQHKYKQQIADCQRAKDEVERLEQERLAKEELKQAHFRLAQEYRAQEQEEKKSLDLKMKETMKESLLNELQEIEKNKERQEALRIKLSVEERNLIDEQRDKIELRKKLELQSQSKEAFSMQCWLKKQREEQEKKEDTLFRKKMMDQLYHEDKLSLMSDQKRRQKQKEHRDQIQNMIQEKRAQQIEEKQEEMVHHLMQKEVEAERERLIANEKRRILEEKAVDLLGFLPDRLLKKNEEVEHLGEEFKQFYRISTTKEP